MLNIGRMAPGRAGYYLQVVADRDAADYYLAKGEEPGRWISSGGLALSGTVRGEQLRAVLEGRHPETGEVLAAHPARKVPGFDLTYRPPKSVSLLWALADRQTAAEVVSAHDAAVQAAVGYLQRQAGFARRGAGGAETVAVEGLVAAGFRHRTSRADDPLLHTHVLVANLARTVDDGVWRTLDSRRLYAHAKTAGVLYQAHLRHELTVRLGVGWGPVVNGTADIAGVDRTLIEAFSRRRAAIVEQLEAHGETSAKAAQVATLATRQAKGVRHSEAELRHHWRTQAAGLGVDGGWWRGLVGRAMPRPPGLERLDQELVGGEGLTAGSSTFTRREVIQAIAERAPTGLPAGDIEHLADQLLERHRGGQVVELGPNRGGLRAVDVIRRHDGRLVPSDPDGRRYTTRGLLLIEQHAITTALTRTGDQVAVVDPAAVERAVKGRGLSDEQTAMVRRLTTSGAGVEVVVGKAGTGKTYALDAARHAWNQAGIPVAGVALAARAALELQQAAAIPSTTLASLLARLDAGAEGVLESGSVLVVDEAGMVGTCQLARLLHHSAERSVKVVLVGDPRQLPEIDAGGLYRALTHRLPAIELTDNRRQQHAWEQAALDELRHGDPTVALDAYRRHGRIVTAATPDQLADQLVDDWWTTARDDLSGSVMIALRRAEVDDLNHRARARMHTDRRLHGPTLHAGDVELQAGDRIVCLRNSQRHGVVNGTRATITHIDPSRRRVEATCGDGRPVTLEAAYLDSGHVAHGYAITGHKAQGLTVDHTYVLGTDALYREWGYVAMSRGRHTNRLYQTVQAQQLDGDHPHVHQHAEPNAALAARMARTRAQQPLTPEVRDLADQWRHLHRRLAAPDIARQRALADRRAALTRQRQADLDQLDRLRRRIEHAAGGLGRLTNRRHLDDLRTEHATRSAALGRLEAQLHTVEAELAALPDAAQIGEWQAHRDGLAHQLNLSARQRVTAVVSAPPGHITAVLGPSPEDLRGRSVWLRTATTIETYRLRWDITHPTTLGPTPVDLQQSADHRYVAATIRHHHQELLRDQDRGRARGLELRRGRAR
jgi:conjugative relaxase-like TrwC/TraI family protein